MKKILMTVLVLAVALSMAGAQVGIGFSGALYQDSGMKTGDFFAAMAKGDGVFYGPFIELGFDTLSLGVAVNLSIYSENMAADKIDTIDMKMVDYDVNLYLQGHLFGYKAFLDPFVEAGIGMMAKDYADEENDPEPDMPIIGTKFFQCGPGIGLNLGGLGLFVKGLYMFPYGTVQGKVSYYDKSGTVETTQTYDLGLYPLKNLKLLLGAKLILE